MGFEPQQPQSTLESANEFAERIALGIEFSLYLLLSIQPLHIFILSSFGLHRLLVGP
jgi:hypothetical protein